MHNLIQHLYSLGNFRKTDLKLESILKVKELLSLNRAKIIHVAGTNGKGSVCYKIASALSDSGYKVGLFTSPHISTFRQRIQIDGKLIGEKEAHKEINHILVLYDQIKEKPTFFEIMTLLALIHFSNNNVDFIVLETGLGGTHDATNIIEPVLTIITSISLDHMDVLGNSLDTIAMEKAGIIKKNIPLILGPKAKFDSILNRANKLQAKVVFVNKTSLFYDEENSFIAKEALLELQKAYPIEKISIEKGISMRAPARFEILNNFSIVLDVAHNQEGIKRLFQALMLHFPNKNFRIVFGLASNKDISSCIKQLCSYKLPVHLISIENTRLLSIEDLSKYFIQIGYRDHFFLDDYKKTLLQAQSMAKENSEILVCLGSFFIMEKIREFLGIIEPKDAVSLNER